MQRREGGERGPFRRNRIRDALGVLATLCLLQCNVADDSGNEPVALEELGEHLAAGICKGIEECGGQDWLPFQKGCKARIGAFLTYGVQPIVEEGVRRNKIQYFSRQMGSCLDELASCGDENHLPVSCFQAISGTMPLGAECKSDLECEGNRYCDGNTCPGICKSWKIPSETCQSQNECEWGLRCREGFCRHPFADGAACENDEQCDYFRLCIVDPNGDLGRTVCMRPQEARTAKIGEQCGWYESPRSAPLCGADLFCRHDGESGGACVAAGGLGGRCSVATPDPCSSLSYCDEASQVCKALPEDGEPCVSVSDSGDNQCAALHYCNRFEGVCRRSKSFNQPCASPFECLSLTCYGGLCKEAFSCDPT